MPYKSFKGGINEPASKSGHSSIINDKKVQEYLKQCRDTRKEFKPDPDLISERLHSVADLALEKPIKFVITVDSGRVFPINIQAKSKAQVIKFSLLLFKLDELDVLKEVGFIDNSDLRRLTQEADCKLILPIFNLYYSDADNIIDSLRLTLYQFFKENNLLEVAHWFFKQDFNPKQKKVVQLHLSCPNVNADGRKCRKILLHNEIISGLTQDNMYRAACPKCHKAIHITDIFGFDERIRTHSLSQSLVGEIVSIIELVFMLAAIKSVKDLNRDDRLGDILFIVDGRMMITPSAFGEVLDRQSGNPVLTILRQLIDALRKNDSLNLIGIEKSGYIHRWALEIASPATKPENLIPSNHWLILDKYLIYSAIILRLDKRYLPAYGQASHYGTPIIFRTKNDKVYTISVVPWKSKPTASDFQNMGAIFQALEEMQCHYYKNAVLPIVLANKHASISFRPSREILTQFLSDHL